MILTTSQEIESLPLKFSDIPEDYLHPRVQGEWCSYGQPDYSVQNVDFSQPFKTEDEDVLALLETRNISYSLVRNLMPLTANVSYFGSDLTLTSNCHTAEVKCSRCG